MLDWHYVIFQRNAIMALLSCYLKNCASFRCMHKDKLALDRHPAIKDTSTAPHPHPQTYRHPLAHPRSTHDLRQIIIFSLEIKMPTSCPLCPLASNTWNFHKWLKDDARLMWMLPATCQYTHMATIQRCYCYWWRCGSFLCLSLSLVCDSIFIFIPLIGVLWGLQPNGESHLRTHK